MSFQFTRAMQFFAHAASQLVGCYERREPWLQQATPLLQVREPAEDWSSRDWACWYRENRHLIASRFSFFSGEKLQSFGPGKLPEYIYRHIQELKDQSLGFLVAGDELYPERLFHTDRPPYGLCFQGDPQLLRKPAVAVIGARKAHRKALRESYLAGKILAQNGVVTVSGGAYGCDIAAHQGVTDSGCGQATAIVVFAGGLGKLYPRGNLKDFQSIVQNGGLLISERFFNQVARPYDFPVRNRIISGLVDEVIVMQAGERSGAMSTARTALDQGRDVLVLIPEEGCPGAEGSLSLIHDGAFSFSDFHSLALEKGMTLTGGR